MNFGIYQTASQVFFGVKGLQSCFLQFNKRNVLVKIVIWTKSDGCFLKGWYIFQSLLLKHKQTNKQTKQKQKTWKAAVLTYLN